MINEKELQEHQFSMNEYLREKSSFRVNAGDMAPYERNQKKLVQKIGLIKLQFQEDNQFKSMKAYEELEERCQINISTLKNTMSEKIPVTRNFLYKLVVGLQFTRDEANELFALFEGKLREDCRADYIVIRALEDRDDIYTFIDDFEKYTDIKIALRNRES